MGDKAGNTAMKKETTRIYIDEDIYISDDGLKRSKFKSEIKDYEENLEADKIIKSFEFGQLSDEVAKYLQELNIVEGRVLPQIYKVASYEEFNTLVGKLEQRHKAWAYSRSVEKYNVAFFEDTRFVFSVDKQYDVSDNLNIYDFNELKQDLKDTIKIANEALSTITFWQDEAGKR